MKSQVYWGTSSDLWAATLLSVVVVLSASYIGIVGLYLYSVFIALYAGLWLFRHGSDSWRLFLLVAIPAFALICGGWVSCHRAIKVLQAREIVDRNPYDEQLACERTLETTSLLLGLHQMVLAFVLIIKKRWSQSFLAVLLIFPLYLLNFFCFILMIGS
jgi:hypothetical protein